MSASPWATDEAGYVEHLNRERHLYAWCLVHFGQASQVEAHELAAEFYPYEPADEHRGIVFHDEAWHYAMLEIFGEHYWLSRPELETPSPHYREAALAKAE